jgi:hypothetical protein
MVIGIFGGQCLIGAQFKNFAAAANLKNGALCG